MFKITSRFYVIYGDGIPIYVGYTNRTIKQRFTEHQHDKDFGQYDKVKVEELKDEKLSFDFTWDYIKTCENADLVSKREAELVSKYNTQESCYQKADGGGQTWASEKSFVKSNQNNPRFIGMTTSEVKACLNERKREQVWLGNFVDSIKLQEQVWLSNFVGRMNPKEQVWLCQFVNNMNPKEHVWLSNFVGNMKPKEQVWLCHFVSSMKPKEQVWLCHFVSSMNPKEHVWVSVFVGNMKPKEQVWLRDFVNNMKPKEQAWLSNFVNNMKPKEQVWLNNFVGHMIIRER